jgi:hypothetical protein
LETVLAFMQVFLLDSAPHSLAGLFRDLEQNGATCLALDHGGAGAHPSIEGYIIDPERNQITGSQLAVERQIEQGQITNPLCDLEPDPNGPDLPSLERRFRSNQLASVPRCGASARMVGNLVLHCSAPETKPPAMNLGRSTDKTQTQHSC